jgi:hypothetical protein
MLVEVHDNVVAAATKQWSFLAYPRLPEGYGAPAGWRPYSPGDRLDAVILTATMPEQAVRLIVDNIKDPLIPIVSFAQNESQHIDFSDKGEASAWERIQNVNFKLQELPPGVRYSTNSEDVLLSRMYSRDEDLAPIYDSRSSDLIRYPVAGRFIDVAETATALFEKGYLLRSFFDRTHFCPQCRSGHLSVREECHSCMSANIDEELVVHHFQCAYEAPESHFRTETGLECPKCARKLRHIGLDYDKPGSMTRCRDCGSINDQPNVGFKCIDCGAHSRSDQVPARTWYAYSMTAPGMQRILQAKEAPEAASVFRSDSFRVLLEYAQREQREFGSLYQVVRVTFANRSTIEAENTRLWQQSLLLVSDVLRSTLREVDAFREEPDGLLILMPRTDAAGARRTMARLATRLASVLEIDLGLDYSLLEPSPLRGADSQAA